MPKKKADDDNCRNPTIKRGRRKDPVKSHMWAYCRNRNQVDMVMASLRHKLIPAVLKLLGKRKFQATLIGYLGRFPPEQQLEQFRIFDKLGARAAKRYFECVNRPPTSQAMVRRIANWLMKEFPPGAVNMLDLAAACERVAVILRQTENGTS